MFRLWKRQRHVDPPDAPILVYQMGKVGSRSLVTALEHAAVGEVLHVHQLNRRSLAALEAKHDRRGFKHPPHIAAARRVLEELLDRGVGLRIVTGVREPIARNASGFFQNLRNFTTLDLRGRPKASTEELTRKFMQEYAQQVVLRWFDRQVKGPLGIDVYRHAFPHERGWQLIEERGEEGGEEGGHRLLIVRAESSDEAKREGLAALLGQEVGPLRRVNAAEDKAYAQRYEEFKRSLRLDESYVKRMLESRYTRHFYTAAEIAGFYERWLPASVASDAGEGSEGSEGSEGVTS